MLEVGMKVYETEYLSRLTISRVTPKRAYIEIRPGYEIAFHRDIGDRTIFHRIGADTWSRECWSLETPELLAKYARKKLVQRFEAIKADDLSMAQISAILDIAKVRGE